MLDRRLVWAFITVVTRYVTSIQPQARRELARWRQRAQAIPDLEVRDHVLRPFDSDRAAEGAALFAALVPRRCDAPVPTLIAYVLLWSYVDVLTERDPDHDPGPLDALVVAFDPAGPSDLPHPDDGGYLADLISACRRGCTSLPSWSTVGGPILRLAAEGRAVQTLNHAPHEHREAALRAWARDQAPAGAQRWHERCAAASGPLAIHALLALAATPAVRASEAQATADAYGSVSALNLLIDHLTDQVEDASLANHSYLSYYESPIDMASRLRDLSAKARRDVLQLRDGGRHLVVLAAMVSGLLSGPAAGEAPNAEAARGIVEAVGPPAPLLFAMLSRRGPHICSPANRPIEKPRRSGAFP